MLQPILQTKIISYSVGFWCSWLTWIIFDQIPLQMRYEMKDNFVRVFDYSPKKTPNFIHNYYDATHLLMRLIKTIAHFDGLPSFQWTINHCGELSTRETHLSSVHIFGWVLNLVYNVLHYWSPELISLLIRTRHLTFTVLVGFFRAVYTLNL